MKEFVATVEAETGGKATGHVGDSFEKVQFAMKLVPNMD